VFEALVKEGASLQKKTQSAAEEKLSGVTSKMTSMAGDVQAKAGQHWDKLESIFEDRTAKALNKLGVPSAKDVDALIARIDDLSAKVAKLSKTEPAKKAAAAKSTAKPAAKRTARKSAAA
jgi:poly(hydroxyalkanoate) granule-associated protein